jgi:hypothetical protein
MAISKYSQEVFMGSRVLYVATFFAVFWVTCFQGKSEAQPPWVQTYQTVRTLYVSPSGTGNGTQSNPMSFSNAINNALAGDLYWMAGGTYNGIYYMTKSGTTGQPIIYRSSPGQRAIINGSIEISGANVWLWGLEISDLPKVSPMDSGVRMLAAGIHLINNVIHHARTNGIGAWSQGTGNVIYGNIVYENGSPSNSGHGIYAQNDFLSFGYKYFVDNILLDSASVCSNCFNFHAYTLNGIITGLHLERNIISNGRFLIGGYGIPADREVVKQNYFYKSNVEFGWRRPTQVEFTNNYLGLTGLSTDYFWGVGETKYIQTAPNVFTGNQILLPPTDLHIHFRTSAYTNPTTRCDGCPKIQSTDTFDNNKYSTPFKAYFYANNTQLNDINFSQWKSATAAAGKAFDASSTEVSAPTATRADWARNAYESNRANLYVYNWSHASNITLGLSPFLVNGDSFQIFNPKSYLGTPVVSGTYNGPVNIPMSGQEFRAFIIRKL